MYAELCGVARRALARGENGGITQPQELVHDAWLKLFAGAKPALKDRRHFVAIATLAMKQLLCDQARTRARGKRGGPGARQVPLDRVLASFDERRIDVLALKEALAALAAEDPELAELAEHRFFGGLSNADAAEQMGRSLRATERSWALVKAWLRLRLGDRTDGPR